MTNHLRVPLVGLLTALALGAMLGTASANRLSVNELRWRHVWSPINFIASTNTIRCNLTVEGSFHSSISRKVMGALSGFATRATVNTCTGGSATILNETLPWHYTYAGFAGTLPSIQRIFSNVIGGAAAVQPTGSLKCLIRTTTEAPGRFETNLGASGEANSITAEESAEIPLEGEGGLCRFAGEGHYGGTGTIRTGSGGTLRVRLI